MATNYDDIADEYLQTKVNPIKKYSEEFTFFEVLGDVHGQSVLDLACGDGYYTRAVRRRGAASVVGIDLSAEMIRQAQAAEMAEPLGIAYDVGDVTRMGAIGAFDVVTAVYLLQYAATENELQGMVDAIYANLKPGGRVVMVTGQPDLTEEHLVAQSHYEVTIKPRGPLSDGVSIDTTILVPGGAVTFTNHHWTKAAYARVFRQAGFHSPVWYPMQISVEGLALYPAEYWQPYQQYPAIAVVSVAR
ncbi:MAG TPA: class I SAM-dependent methyltransferase [Chloroflexota bacterium]|nr:class I SAM-dependent methyltransferase [Chloroflexota bacterium]